MKSESDERIQKRRKIKMEEKKMMEENNMADENNMMDENGAADQEQKKPELQNQLLQQVIGGLKCDTNRSINKRVDYRFIPIGYTGAVYTYYCLREQMYYACTSKSRATCQNCSSTIVYA